MTFLQPGIRVVSAPHFHLAGSLADRLEVNSGVLVEPDRVVPRGDWRQPSLDELALLTAPSSQLLSPLPAGERGRGDEPGVEKSGDPAETITLFNMPDRLRARWWDSAPDPSAGSEAGRVAFQGFAAQVLEFLQFKRLPLPPACAFELVIHAPGQATTRPLAGGLASNQPLHGLLGAINLSDEGSALVFLNLGNTQLSSWLPRLPASASLPDRARAFFSAFPDYPIIKLDLRPGEGYWLPPSQVVIDCDTRGRSEVDVQLVLRVG